MTLAEKMQLAVAVIAFAALMNGLFSYAGARRGRRDSAVKMEAEHAAVLKETRDKLNEHLAWADEQRSVLQGDIEEVKEKTVGLDSGVTHLRESVGLLVASMARTNEKLDTLVGEFRVYRNGTRK